MNLIVLMRRAGKTRHVDLGRPTFVAGAALAALTLLVGVFFMGLSIGSAGNARLALNGPTAFKTQLQDRVDALALRIGSLDAQLLRLNALGKRLTEMANIRSNEFDFDRDPPQGGPDLDDAGRGVSLVAMDRSMARVESLFDFKNAQLGALENVLQHRQLSRDIIPAGKPVHEGYISSGFGERMDPFNGEEAFHKGIDFAAPLGADVMAVAAGIVTSAEAREGFGVTVEVQHGNGYVTRYAHNSRALVKLGDVVQRGQRLAVVGTTGRSTGPHVHFEVLKNDKAVNPADFLSH